MGVIWGDKWDALASHTVFDDCVKKLLRVPCRRLGGGVRHHLQRSTANSRVWQAGDRVYGQRGGERGILHQRARHQDPRAAFYNDRQHWGRVWKVQYLASAQVSMPTVSWQYLVIFGK